MTTTDLKVGCQTFTWEMLGDAWDGRPGRPPAGRSATAAMPGIEITDTMIGALCQPARRLRRGARRATASSSPPSPSARRAASRCRRRSSRTWRPPQRWIDFAARFPGGAGVDRLGDRGVGRPARGQVRRSPPSSTTAPPNWAARPASQVAVHPSSHHNTLLFDRADYDRIFALLDPALVGWVPDTGHILRGHRGHPGHAAHLSGPHPLPAPEGRRRQRRLGDARGGRLRHARRHRDRARGAEVHRLAGARRGIRRRRRRSRRRGAAEPRDHAPLGRLRSAR